MPSILEDEQLSDAVREYPVLYSKSNALHKDRTVVSNAWTKVAEVCNLETPELAKKNFENLKKRFSKRRKESTGPSGTGRESVAEAKERLRELSFLAWLAPHVQLRQTKTNCPKPKLKKSAAETICDAADLGSTDSLSSDTKAVTQCKLRHTLRQIA